LVGEINRKLQCFIGFFSAGDQWQKWLKAFTGKGFV